MTKRIIIFGKFLTILALTSHIDIYSMEITNKNLLSLPNEIICLILAHSIDMTQSLKNIIISCLQLSTVCKRFNMTQLFITIGTACSRYDATDKNTLMKNLLNTTNEKNYNNRRNGAFLLTYAGADNNQTSHPSLLRQAISFNDKELIAALFKNNVNPNQINFLGNPDFFYIKTINIAQIFIDNSVDLTIQGNGFSENIIWKCIDFNDCPKLIEFYLNHNANVNTLKTDGSCILHFLARGHYCRKHNTQDNITVATLILKKSPDMINALCKGYECKLTPLDISQKIIKRYGRSEEKHKTLTELIALFKSYGGKTAQELFIDKKHDPLIIF